METVVFAVFALTALAGAVLVIAASRVVYSALALVVCFLAVAGLFILQGAEFLGAVQILLYAGSVVVMFVFVVMMMNLRDSERGDWTLPRAAGGIVLGAAVLGQLLMVLARSRGGMSLPSQGPVSAEGHVQILGKALFREYLLPFEVLSVILLAALFGMLVLGRRK